MSKPKNFDLWDDAKKEKYRMQRREQKQRERLASKTGIRFPRGRGTVTDWDKVDWFINDREIAELVGCSNTAVNYQRRKRKHRKPALLWEKLGFKSKNEWTNFNERERRKNYPITDERRNVINKRSRERIAPKWKELGFSCKYEWVKWREQKKANRPCSKCGGQRHIQSNGKYVCRSCHNKWATKRNKETGFVARRAMGVRLALKDYYIADLLGINSSMARIFPELIDAKREQIKILRELKPTNKKQTQCTRIQSTCNKSETTSLRPHTPHGSISLSSLELSSWSTPWVKQLIQLLSKSKPQR